MSIVPPVVIQLAFSSELAVPASVPPTTSEACLGVMVGLNGAWRSIVPEVGPVVAALQPTARPRIATRTARRAASVVYGMGCGTPRGKGEKTLRPRTGSIPLELPVRDAQRPCRALPREQKSAAASYRARVLSAESRPTYACKQRTNL